MKRTLPAALGAVALSATALICLSPAAQASTAATDWHHCPRNTFCLYEKNAYRGKMKSFTHNVPNLAVVLWQGSANKTVNDQASSMINRTGHNVVLYKDRNYHGTTYLALPNSRDSDFNRGQTFNDKASSLKFLR